HCRLRSSPRRRRRICRDTRCGGRPRRLRVLRGHDPRIHEHGPRAAQRSRPHTPPHRELAGRTLAQGIEEAREEEHPVDALSVSKWLILRNFQDLSSVYPYRYLYAGTNWAQPWLPLRCGYHATIHSIREPLSNKSSRTASSRDRAYTVPCRG